ncbi:MAG TPA: O-antigen ligase family protein [Candidatus Baltobacteraceae bacterium]
MHLHPVVDQTIQSVPLGPLAAIVYVAVLVGAVFMTKRRPIVGVCLLVVLQPFAYYANIFGTTITLPKVALVGVLLGCVSYSGSIRVLQERTASRILLAAMLVAAATVLSVLHAMHKGAALREVLKIVEYIVLFATVYVAYRFEPNRDLVRAAAIGVTIVVALAALSQEIIGAPSGLFINGHPIPRIAGPLEGPNQLAGYFDISIPLLFAYCIERSEPYVHLALALAVFADLLTFSRSGAIAALIAIAIVAIVWRKRELRDAFVYTGVGLACGAGVALIWGIIAHSGAVARFLTLKESHYAGGVGTRSQLWPAAIKLWLRHPIFGVGAGNFELELPLVGLHGIRTHANSLYLQALVEGGLPQIAATLFLVYTSIAAFFRERGQSALVLGAFAASIALAVHQIDDYLIFYPKIGGWWWIVLALGAAELAHARRTAPECA